MKTTVLTSLLCFGFAPCAYAVNPAQVALGQQLFTQEFSPTTPGLNGDGLGPVFNEASCVACHHVGGVGGSGDASKNARSLGLNEGVYRRLDMPNRMNVELARFSPGFISPDGSVNMSFPMHRRGGTAALEQLRTQSMSHFNSGWNDDGALSTDSVHAEREVKSITNDDGSLTLKVSVFARNTTSLFGSGLIDQIPDSAIRQIASQQRRDQEVSGRPGTLDDGRIGKFGWRANFATLVDFNENACSAELGLQSKRVKQPSDMTNASYVNANPDISDDAILAMNAFVTSLPRPQREFPKDSKAYAMTGLGEQRFHAIGCAKCHVPSLGGVADLYSDILLHDMGPYSIDLASSPPYLVNVEVGDVELSRSASSSSSRDITSTRMAGSYYGFSWPGGTFTRTETTETNQRQDSVVKIPTGSRRRVKYIQPQQYPPKREIYPIADPVTTTSRSAFESDDKTQRQTTTMSITTQTMMQKVYEPTLINQEWKTPPLWGVRDSAPYMHDGRAATILEAIAMHDGEGRGSRNRFFALTYSDQQAVLAFLDTFVAPTQGVIEAPRKFTNRKLVSR